MPSLDYIEKLAGIKEEWIQNLKETNQPCFSGSLPPQEHICPHCGMLQDAERDTIRASSNIPTLFS